MIITLANARDQIQKGLNNRSQMCCHCLLFWCVHCDEPESVPCSLTYRLIYSGAAHLPSNPANMTRFERKKSWEEAVTHWGRERSDDVICTKFSWWKIFGRESEWKWANWSEGFVTPLQLVRWLWNRGCDVRQNERDKNTARSKWLLMMRTKGKEGGWGGRNKLESSLLIVLSHFDVSAVNTMYFHHLWLLSEHMMAEDYIYQWGGWGEELWKRYANLAKEQKNNIKYVPKNSPGTFKS